MRFESQFSGMNCHVFLRVEFRVFCRQGDQRDVWRDDQFGRETPARMIDEKSGVAPGAIWVAISARWRFIASVSQRGMTSAAPLPSLGQIAPKI